MDTQTDRIYLDTASAAGFCSIAASTLAKLRVFGGGPPYSKIGRRVIYRASDLDAWMNAHRRANTSAVGFPRQPNAENDDEPR